MEERSGFLSTFFLLMVLTVDYGWGIAPINGNPFGSMDTCLTTIKDIKNLHPTKLHGKFILDIVCLEREHNYLERKNNEPHSQIHTAVDIF